MRVNPTSSSVSKGENGDPVRKKARTENRSFPIGIQGKGTTFTATRGADNQQALKASRAVATYMSTQPLSQKSNLRSRVSTQNRYS